MRVIFTKNNENGETALFIKKNNDMCRFSIDGGGVYMMNGGFHGGGNMRVCDLGDGDDVMRMG